MDHEVMVTLKTTWSKHSSNLWSQRWGRPSKH